MKKPTSIAALTYVQRKDWERARLKEISLKWAKIARAHAKEDFPSAEINPSSGYEFHREPTGASHYHVLGRRAMRRRTGIATEWHFAQTGYAERASGSNGR